MAETKTSPGLVVGALAYLLGLVGLCVALGVASGSPWPGLLCFAGLVTLHVVSSRAAEQKFDGAFLAMWLGAWAISAAGTLGEYGGRWLWAVPWVLAGLILLSIGAAARNTNKWVVQAGVILGFWSLAWAFVGPMWLYGMNQQETQEFMLDFARQWWWALLIGLLLVSTLSAWVTSRSGRPTRPSPRKPPTPAPHKPDDQAAFEQMLREIEEQVRRDEEQRERDRRRERNRAVEARAAREHERDARLAGRPDRPVIESQPPDLGNTVLAPATPEGTVLAGNVARTDMPSVEQHGELLCAAAHPLVDAVLTPSGPQYLLFEDGTMARWDRGSLAEVPEVSVDRPVGAAVADSDVVVAARPGRLAEVRHADRAIPDLRWHHLDLTIGAFALNPFGTIVAFAPVRRHDVFAVLLGPDATQTLAVEVGAVSALAFSGDGRVLAMGLRDGRVVLLDMSTRQPAATLDPASRGRSAVTELRPCPDGGWVAGYGDGTVAHWDEARRLIGTARLRNPVTRLAVGPSSIAVGSTDGRVFTEPPDLSEVLTDTRVGDDAVVGLAVEPDDGSLLVATHDGAVRKIVP